MIHDYQSNVQSSVLSRMEEEEPEQNDLVEEGSTLFLLKKTLFTFEIVLHQLPAQESISRIEALTVQLLQAVLDQEVPQILGRDLVHDPTLFCRTLAVLNLCHSLLLS